MNGSKRAGEAKNRARIKMEIVANECLKPKKSNGISLRNEEK